MIALLNYSNSFNNPNNFINGLKTSNHSNVIDRIKEMQIRYDDGTNYYSENFKFSDFYNKPVHEVYFGCPIELYHELVNNGILYPKMGVSGLSRESAYKSMSDLLGWGGMFFGWIIPMEEFDYARELDYTDKVLLTLEIPTEYLIPHGYYEWCDFIFPNIDSKSTEEAEECCREEFNMSLEDLKLSVFNPNFANPGVEVFIKLLKKDWIVRKRYINSILI